MIYFLLTILILFAVWNAFVILWYTEKTQKYSKIWHSIGLAVRVAIYAVPFFVFTNWIDAVKWTLAFVAVGGVLYDFIINLIRFIVVKSPPLFYVDNKGWNAFFLKFLSAKIYWILRILFVIAACFILIF